MQPAEIVGLKIRQPANAFSTASNWTFNFVVVMVTGPSFNNISWGTYIGALLSLTFLDRSPFMLIRTGIVFASLNALIIPIVYLFFPETAGRSLEGTFPHA